MMLRIHELNAYTIPEAAYNSLLLQFSTSILSVLNRYLQTPTASRHRSVLARIYKSISTLHLPSITSQLTDWISQFASSSSSSLEQSVDLVVCILFLLRESRFGFAVSSAEHSMNSVLQALQQLAAPEQFENAAIEKLLLYLIIVCHEADAISQTEDLSHEDDSEELSDEARAAQFETQTLFDGLNSLVSTLFSTELLPSAFTAIVRRIPQTSLTSKSRVCALASLHCSRPIQISRPWCCSNRTGSRRSRSTRCTDWAFPSPRSCSTCSSTT